MLQKTFVHLPGVGETTERKMWELGILDWRSYLEAHRAGRLAGRKFEHLDTEVEESIRRHTAGDWTYFDRALPTRHKWRAWEDFRDQVAFVDIETTGFVGTDCITVIGIFDGREYRAYVRGRNLDAAAEDLARYPLVVTFNGAQFDLPIIRMHFPHQAFNHIHVDLRYPLKALGYKGGLKKIERLLGLARSESTTGLDGWAAVRLWQEYRSGCAASLDLLLAYNAEDVRNLAPLMQLVYERLAPDISITG